ncbi:Protein prenyltransferase alpha subunit repeat-containing protein 1 [Chelonia mydas]|uniref:Protein prenyltransferase alpha subunit repeat-containing protein 1 n=1 Tax=Chelonia mydas TaxID=8469 RepID=M7BQN7_CHEMY|nr:Protein prenyltransferase alpha subunit repeat-containing protein 1 [Chelonia mydas]
MIPSHYSGVCRELIDITCTLLLLNPDFTTAWNVRRWVLQQLIQENSLPTLVTKGNLGTVPVERIQRLVQEEMDVCCEAAGRYPSNYNAWSHRIWILQRLGKLDVKILLDELSSTKHWVSMHVSDHSGFHYRKFLIKSLIGRTVTDNSILVQNQLVNEPTPSLPKDEKNEASEAVCTEELRVDLPHLLEEELELCTDLIDTFPGHETLWCYRRHVFYLQHHLNNKIPLPNVRLTSVDSSDGTLNNSHPSTAVSHVTHAMDVDGLNDSSKQGYTQEIKRLKRAPIQDSLGLEMEYRFIDNILATCRDVEQARLGIDKPTVLGADYRENSGSSVVMKIICKRTDKVISFTGPTSVGETDRLLSYTLLFLRSGKGMVIGTENTTAGTGFANAGTAMGPVTALTVASSLTPQAAPTSIAAPMAAAQPLIHHRGNPTMVRRRLQSPRYRSPAPSGSAPRGQVQSTHQSQRPDLLSSGIVTTAPGTVGQRSNRHRPSPGHPSGRAQSNGPSGPLRPTTKLRVRDPGQYR